LVDRPQEQEYYPVMEKLKKSIIRAVVKMLTPFARILLRHEISHSEFVELSKRAYVIAARKYYSIPNRKNTFARIAVITGLNLKEVRRLSHIEEDALPEIKGPLNRANQVISGWLSDTDFIDEKKNPKTLPLRNAVDSFEELVMRYSGNITAGAVLDELLRVGAVLRTENGSVKLVKQGFIPHKSETESIKILAKHTSDLLNTGIHNITHDEIDSHFQRQVTYADLPESVIEEFRIYSNEKSLELLKDYDKWLSEKKSAVDPSNDEEKGRIGVGIYYFKNDEEEG